MSERYDRDNSTYSYDEDDLSYEESDSSHDTSPSTDFYGISSEERIEDRYGQTGHRNGSRSHAGYTETAGERRRTDFKKRSTRGGYDTGEHSGRKERTGSRSRRYRDDITQRARGAHQNDKINDRSRHRAQRGYSSSGRNIAGRKHTRVRHLNFRFLIIPALAAAIIFVVILYRIFSVPGEYDASTIVFGRDGSLVVNTVEEFNKDYYDVSELEQTIDNAVSAYGDGVTKKKLEVRSGIAYLTMEYNSTEDYTSFNDTKMFDGTLSEAQAAGYDLSGLISRPDLSDSGRIFAQKDLDELADSACIITEEQSDIIVPEDVRFYTANLSMEDTSSRKLKAADTIDADHPAIVILKK